MKKMITFAAALSFLASTAAFAANNPGGMLPPHLPPQVAQMRTQQMQMAQQGRQQMQMAQQTQMRDQMAEQQRIHQMVQQQLQRRQQMQQAGK